MHALVAFRMHNFKKRPAAADVFMDRKIFRYLLTANRTYPVLPRVYSLKSAAAFGRLETAGVPPLLKVHAPIRVKRIGVLPRGDERAAYEIRRRLIQ